MSDYRVNLETFAGPLDLLLYLVRKDEVDIYDISIAQITEEYIKYIEILQNLDIDIAGDFLVMAAALMEIKSAMLLPKVEEGQIEDDDQELDPRGDLIRQLLEYKKFKDAANLLDISACERTLRFTRPDVIMDKLEPDAEPEVEIEQISVWDLLEAFDNIMKATGSYRDYSHIKDDTPIDLYQIEILHRLQSEGAMTFAKVFENSKNKLVSVGLFLGLLELIRQKLIWVEQEQALDDIFIKHLTDEPAEEAVRKAILADVSTDETTKMESAGESDENKPDQREKISIPIQELPNKSTPQQIDSKDLEEHKN